ncbi:DUF342 domain-containing protein [Orenia marismortui]|uniref:Flagellar Assembly Protein A N-terminal region domain-containing protein n=1 Tax=Orenia marismortui TaxID=46469 RepID=A0A4R8H4Q3_9FIRM|nr:FapA family protein [Orenia marismortui]TDX51905.1 hypothetical protein C7959_10928 [Orenia marismortui]
MSEVKKIRVEAKNKEEALEKAYNSFNEEVERDFKLEDISLNLLEEHKKVFGLFGNKLIYEAILELEDEIESKDGDFEVVVCDEGIFVEVYQPEGNGREVRMDMIEEVIEEKKIVEVDYGAISEALTLDGERVKIAERDHDLDLDAEVKVDISDDKMEAYISYTPPLGGKKLDLNQMIKRLNDEGVVFGIKEEEFAANFNPNELIERFLIATGQEPTPGKDGQINLNFDLNREQTKVNLREDGSVDFRNLDRIINVEAGDLLATRELAVEGKSGKNVKGETVPPEPVQDVKISAGENVELSEDGMSAIAEIEGQVVYAKDTINVLDVYTVKGDVDLTTGNIDFNGSVVVNQNVTEGMQIKAQGNVLIKGSVYGGIIEAEGQVVIKKGFVGAIKGEIRAKGDVEIKFVENASIFTEGSLIVEDAIMHSNIDVGEKVIVKKKKGLIVGGKVRAAKEIDAKIIGSNLATPTEIFVGVTPELRDEFTTKDALFKDKQDKLDQIIKNIKLLKKQREENAGKLSPKKQDLLNQLTRARFSIASEIEKIKAERNDLADKLKESKEGKVKASDTLYSGVLLTMGTSMKKIDESKERVQYYIDNGEVKSKPYS